MERLSVEGLGQTHGQAPAFRTGQQVAASSEVKVTPGGPRPASPESQSFLRRLVAERYPSASEEYIASVIAQGQARVSQAIDKLKAMPKVAQAAPAPRVNRYGGQCEECGTRVEPEAGVLTKSDEGKWEVAHKPGECPISEYPFPVGRYAVDGHDGLRFYVASHDGFFVMASDELHPVAYGPRATIIARIAEDPEAASRLYGQNIGKCGRCGRTLTDEVSRAQGIGPVCATKGW